MTVYTCNVHCVSSLHSRSYPVIDQSSQEALTIVSPTHHPNKRVKVESSPRYADRNGRYIKWTGAL